ncbi:MAG TPA: dephospho-CoA kinase [Verrucomicrobiae bacterium]|nr:dephospho-CoA kinase [Verrucomicrobiae bacterium]
MTLLGLTGGVGMGKSVCARLLESRGIPVVDTDDLARRVVEPGQPALAEVARVFGREILDEEGRLRRNLIGQRVFSDPRARKQLEAILHPRIRELWRARASQWRKEGRPLGAVAIPLLFETGAEQELDMVICLACSARTQFSRLEARGWTAEHIRQRIEAQLPIDQKIARSDRVVWTEMPIEIHELQLLKIVRKLRVAS